MPAERPTPIEQSILEGIRPNDFLRPGFTEITDPAAKYELIDRYTRYPLAFSDNLPEAELLIHLDNLYLGVQYEPDPHNRSWLRIKKIRVGNQIPPESFRLQDKDACERKDSITEIEYLSDGRVSIIYHRLSPERTYSFGHKPSAIQREYFNNQGTYREKIVIQEEASAGKTFPYTSGKTDQPLHVQNTSDQEETIASEQAINLLQILFMHSAERRVNIDSKKIQVHVARTTDGTRGTITYSATGTEETDIQITISGPILDNLALGNGFNDQTQLIINLKKRELRLYISAPTTSDPTNEDDDSYRLNSADIGRLTTMLQKCVVTWPL